MHGSALLDLRFDRGRLGLIALLLLTAAPGCSRQHWRQRADKDVAGIITQKNVFPAWQVKNWHVYPDPRSRFADPSRPDHPPYPPDDYAARVLSPNPQRPWKKFGTGRFEGDGYLQILAGWDAENRAREAAEGNAEEKKDGGYGPAPPPQPPMPPEKLLPPKSLPALPEVPPIPKAPLGGEGLSHQGADAPRRRGYLNLQTPVSPPSPGALDSGLHRDVDSPLSPGEMGSRENQGPLAPRSQGPVGYLKLPAADSPRSPEVPSSPPRTQWRAKGSLPPPSVSEVHDNGVLPASVQASEDSKIVPAMSIAPAVLPPGVPPDPMGVPKPPPTEGAVPAECVPFGPASLQPGNFPPGAGSRGPLPLISTDQAPDFLAALATNEAGYRIRMEQAVQLGLINSREFQDRREDLYLAALPVTLERFNFAALGFFTEAAMLDFAGRALGRVPRNRATLATGTGFSKLFPTGALLMVRLANQVVIDLSNGRPTTTVSNVSLSLAQPFLQGGGYAVTLEPLTLAERNMLYAIRSYARFRKLFYVAVSAGSAGNITNNPYGLQGLSVNLGRGIGGNLTAPSIGFLPLLLQSASLNNQVKNVQALDGLLNLYRAFREGGQYSDLQVAQVEQQLLNSRNSLLGSSTSGSASGGGGGGASIRGYLDTLDSFKLQLGLPMTVGLDLDYGPLKPIYDQLARFDSLYADLRQAEADGRTFNPASPIEDFRPRWRRLFTESRLVKGTAFSKNIVSRWAAWEKLSDEELQKRLSAMAAERRAILDRQADRQVKGQPQPKEELLRLEQLTAEIDLGQFERMVRIYESQPWQREKGKLRDTLQAAAFRDVFNTFFQVILEGRNERLEMIRQQWPELPPIIVNGQDLLEVTLDEATTAGMQVALSQRLDLMNARAQVVDAWRQIKIQANSLQGVLDVEYNLDTSTPPGGANPVALSGTRTNHNVTIQGELPLVRRAQRNNYRAALISYQRQRRTMMSFEDNISNDVRSDIRAVRTIASLYKVQQRLVELGYFQFDNAQAVLLAPPAPGAQAGAGDAAALTNQVLQAQSSLLSSQNSLYTIYVNYLIARMALYLDLEEMQIDERGVWCNEFHTRNDNPDGPAPAPGAPRGERLPAPRAIPESQG